MILVGDALDMLATLESESIQTCVTSPPYWGLRDYGVAGQLGNEVSPFEYIEKMVHVFRGVRRAMKPDGTLWLNLGDSYCGGGNNRGNASPISDKQKSNAGATGQVSKFGVHKFQDDNIKPKDLVGIPWRVAFALQADGWYLRQDIIWHKPNPMPESVRDRCTKAHEYIFLLSKSPRYYFNIDAIKEPAVCGHNGSSFVSAHDMATKRGLGTKPRPSQMRGPGNIRQVTHPQGQRPCENSNVRGSLHKIGERETRQKRSVWTVTTKPFRGAHFATFPPDLIEPCILAGSREGDTVLDPFFGAGTTGLVATKHFRKYVGIELNEQYAQMARDRIGLALGAGA